MIHDYSVPIHRRRCIGIGAASIASGILAQNSHHLAAWGNVPAKKSVAAVVTVYFANSHADVILGKILEGWLHDGGDGPLLKLESIYIDQFSKNDIGRSMCQKHGIPIFDSIEKAITVGGNSLPVDGVISIGEHGDYPYNDIGQHLYPRRRFFQEITATFEKYHKIVPVFSDKHLGPTWTDARWMYDRAKDLRIPLMAGSSLPVGYRRGEIDVPMGAKIEAAVGIGYSGLDVYGIHALEFYQYYIERRAGAESGVRAVRFLSGESLWQAVDTGVVSKRALQAAFDAVPKSGAPDMRMDKQAGLFLFEYVDGFQGAVLMLSCVAGTSIGLTLKEPARTMAVAFDERSEPRYPHFAYLVKAIEKMMHTGEATYPVERTLLTSGVLDRVLTSRARGGVQLVTPELSISYKPVDYPHAPHVAL
ncbi:MAG: hypothetical protein ABL921_34710 [Pirellula sp.]